MATRRKKTRLGSTWKVHQVQMRNAEGRMTLQRFERYMEKGECGNALVELYNLGVDVGQIAAHRNAMGRKSEAHDDGVLNAAVKKAYDATDLFKFQCVVGEAFAGLKKRRR